MVNHGNFEDCVETHYNPDNTLRLIHKSGFLINGQIIFMMISVKCHHQKIVISRFIWKKNVIQKRHYVEYFIFNYDVKIADNLADINGEDEFNRE